MLNFAELERFELRELIMDIRKDEYLGDALLRHGKTGIPSHVILNKALPGLGATYCEIEADRPSIIIEPNVPVIINKEKKHAHLMGVYKGVTTDQVINYLRKHKKRPKLMTTPESFCKVKQAMEEEGIDMHKDFFLLFDECEKIVQDIDYRESLELPLNDFFLFRSKAFVSATPILPYDPRFKEAGFATLRIKPNFTYRKPIRLITTNNVLETLYEVIGESKRKVCIFTNSVDTIDSVYKDSKHFKQSATFCSDNAIEKLYDRRYRKASSSIDKLEKVNFFTGRFFSAVDIDLATKPDVILISDLHGAEQSVIDPATQAIQIAGRFRNGIRSLTHIASIRPALDCKTETEAKVWLTGAASTHKEWNKLCVKASNPGVRDMYLSAIETSAFGPYIKNGELNYLMVSNYIDQERVKSLYRSATDLREAYKQVHYFDVTHEDRQHLLSDEDRLARHRATTRKGRRKILLIQFERLEALRFSPHQKDKDRYQTYIGRLLTNEKDALLYDCYLRKGSEYIRKVDFNEKVITKQMQLLGSGTLKKGQYIRAKVLTRFKEGETYSRSDVSTILGALYRKEGLPMGKRINATSIKKWFKVQEINTNSIRSFKIIEKTKI